MIMILKSRVSTVPEGQQHPWLKQKAPLSVLQTGLQAGVLVYPVFTVQFDDVLFQPGRQT